MPDGPMPCARSRQSRIPRTPSTRARPPAVYLDNAATTQKPQRVIDALRHYYEQGQRQRAIVAWHTLSERATDAYEKSRDKVRAFVNARSTREIVFTRNATESINLVARAWGDANVHAGDEVLITAMEHHSNIVPWQQLCGPRRARRSEWRRSTIAAIWCGTNSKNCFRRGRRSWRRCTCRMRSAPSIPSRR